MKNEIWWKELARSPVVIALIITAISFIVALFLPHMDKQLSAGEDLGLRTCIVSLVILLLAIVSTMTYYFRKEHLEYVARQAAAEEALVWTCMRRIP